MIVITRTVQQSKTNAQDWPKEYVCNFLEAGLVNYSDVGAGIAKLSKETIMNMMQSFVGKPVVVSHIDVTPKDFMDHAVGYITRVWFDDYTGWAYCAFILTDDKAKQKVGQGYSVSCAYDVLRTGPGGEWHAIQYDEEILEGSGTHLALVTSPRYEDCRILVNSKKATVKPFMHSVVVKVNQQKEDSKMIQLFRKANDKAGAEFDPKDPTKQKWNAEQLYVQIENEYVPLSELAKHAKENEFAAAQSVENEMEINGAVHNVADLIENFKASKTAKKNADDKDGDEKKGDEKKENAEGDDKGDKKGDEKKENADESKEEGDAKKKEETVKENEKDGKRDVKHFVKLNTARDNGRGAATVIIDTMTNRVERGADRYGSAAKK